MEVKVTPPFLKIGEWAQEEHPNGVLQLRERQVKFIFLLIVGPAAQPAHMDHHKHSLHLQNQRQRMEAVVTCT